MTPFAAQDVVWQKLDSPGYLNAPMRSGTVFSNHLSCPNAYLIPPPANYGFSIHGTRCTSPSRYVLYRKQLCTLDITICNDHNHAILVFILAPLLAPPMPINCFA